MTRYQYVIFHDGTIDAFMEKEPRLSFSDPLSSVYRVNSHVLNSMLCKVVKFKIKFIHGSIITGKGTFVYGAGGNKDSIIIDSVSPNIFPTRVFISISFPSECDIS